MVWQVGGADPAGSWEVTSLRPAWTVAGVRTVVSVFRWPRAVAPGCPGAKKHEFLTSVLDALSTDMVHAVSDPSSASGRLSEPDPSHTLEERVVHWYFKLLDRNSSGDIGKKEIKPFKRFLRKKSKPKKCVKKFVEYCDANNDNALSVRELMGCLGVAGEDSSAGPGRRHRHNCRPCVDSKRTGQLATGNREQDTVTIVLAFTLPVCGSCCMTERHRLSPSYYDSQTRHSPPAPELCLGRMLSERNPPLRSKAPSERVVGRQGLSHGCPRWEHLAHRPRSSSSQEHWSVSSSPFTAPRSFVRGQPAQKALKEYTSRIHFCLWVGETGRRGRPGDCGASDTAACQQASGSICLSERRPERPQAEGAMQQSQLCVRSWAGNSPQEMPLEKVDLHGPERSEGNLLGHLEELGHHRAGPSEGAFLPSPPALLLGLTAFLHSCQCPETDCEPSLEACDGGAGAGGDRETRVTAVLVVMVLMVMVVIWVMMAVVRLVMVMVLVRMVMVMMGRPLRPRCFVTAALRLGFAADLPPYVTSRTEQKRPIVTAKARVGSAGVGTAEHSAQEALPLKASQRLGPATWSEAPLGLGSLQSHRPAGAPPHPGAVLGNFSLGEMHPDEFLGRTVQATRVAAMCVPRHCMDGEHSTERVSFGLGIMVTATQLSSRERKWSYDGQHPYCDLVFREKPRAASDRPSWKNKALEKREGARALPLPPAACRSVLGSDGRVRAAEAASMHPHVTLQMSGPTSRLFRRTRRAAESGRVLSPRSKRPGASDLDRVHSPARPRVHAEVFGLCNPKRLHSSLQLHVRISCKRRTGLRELSLDSLGCISACVPLSADTRESLLKSSPYLSSCSGFSAARPWLRKSQPTPSARGRGSVRCPGNTTGTCRRVGTEHLGRPSPDDSKATHEDTPCSSGLCSERFRSRGGDGTMAPGLAQGVAGLCAEASAQTAGVGLAGRGGELRGPRCVVGELRMTVLHCWCSAKVAQFLSCAGSGNVTDVSRHPRTLSDHGVDAALGPVPGFVPGAVQTQACAFHNGRQPANTGSFPKLSWVDDYAEDAGDRRPSCTLIRAGQPCTQSPGHVASTHGLCFYRGLNLPDRHASLTEIGLPAVGHSGPEGRLLPHPLTPARHTAAGLCGAGRPRLCSPGQLTVSNGRQTGTWPDSGPVTGRTQLFLTSSVLLAQAPLVQVRTLQMSRDNFCLPRTHFKDTVALRASVPGTYSSCATAAAPAPQQDDAVSPQWGSFSGGAMPGLRGTMELQDAAASLLLCADAHSVLAPPSAGPRQASPCGQGGCRALVATAGPGTVPLRPMSQVVASTLLDRRGIKQRCQGSEGFEAVASLSGLRAEDTYVTEDPVSTVTSHRAFVYRAKRCLPITSPDTPAPLPALHYRARTPNGAGQSTVCGMGAGMRRGHHAGPQCISVESLLGQPTVPVTPMAGAQV
ncbi:SPARC-related modular calcium-binding protein 2 [Tupaia chinensis]|uniref:SPARC-related modular calcium-binding protein 2 n=1 Tax=Tupaia chinensis TaxID=246437 RepID=L9L205_TUPCH|nr:SPARC-related modular calcium-binding protein 2 [Tupaia chinensis]